jgi:YVTN family beta-propeller protein
MTECSVPDRRRRDRTPPPSRIYVTNMVDNTVSVIDGITHRVVTTIPVPARPTGIVTAPGRKRVYVAHSTLATASSWGSTAEDLVSIIDTATDSVVSRATVSGAPQQLVMTPGGQQIYALSRFSEADDAVEDAGAISVLDTASQRLVAVLRSPVIDNVQSLAVARDGRQVYAGTGNDYILIIDTTTHVVIGQVETPGVFPLQVAAAIDTDSCM